MKKKILFVFLFLTLFGISLFLNNSSSPIVVEAATELYQTSKESRAKVNVIGNPNTKMIENSDIESQSDSNVIDKVSVDVIDEIFDYYYTGGNFSNWSTNQKDIFVISDEDKEKYSVESLQLKEYIGSSVYDRAFSYTFRTNYSYRFYVKLAVIGDYLFGDKNTVESLNPNVTIDYPVSYTRKYIYATIDLGSLPAYEIDDLQFSLATNFEQQLVVDRTVHPYNSVSANSYIKIQSSYSKKIAFNGSCIVDENKVELTSSSKYEANKTYYVKTNFITGKQITNSTYHGYVFSKNMECPGFEIEVDETGEILTVYYEFVPKSNVIEEFNVVIDVEKLGPLYPDMTLFNKDRKVITSTDYSQYVTLYNSSMGDTIALTYGDKPLSQWDWSTNPITSSNTSTGFNLADGVYAGYFATFRTYAADYAALRFSANTVVNAVDNNGNELEGVYTVFKESGDYKYLIVVYDLGQCKRSEVEKVEITVSDVDLIKGFTKLYPGSSFNKLGYNRDQLKTLLSLTQTSINQQELIDNVYYDVDGIYKTNEDPSTITDMGYWTKQPYATDYFIEGEQYAFVFKFYIYKGNNVDKKYDFIEGMQVEFVDENGNKIEGLNAYALPYYYNGKRYAEQFNLVVYFEPVAYAGVINELDFSTSEGITWPTNLKPGVLFRDAFPGIAEKYNNEDYNIITSSSEAIVEIYQNPGMSDFNINNISPDIGLVSLYPYTDSYGNNIYSVIDEYDFNSDLSLYDGDKYFYGFVIELAPGYRLSDDVNLPENYQIEYSLIDEMNSYRTGSGYGWYGSSQLYWIVYTIGTAENDKITNLGITFNESLLSNVKLQHSEHSNVYDEYIPNYEFVTYSNKVGFSTESDKFNQFISEEYDGNVDNYWNYQNEYYLEEYGIEIPEKNRYVNDGFWRVYQYGEWQYPDWTYKETETGSYYEFMLLAGKTYGFYYSIVSEPGYVFDLDAIAEELEAAGFIFDYYNSNNNKVCFGYVVGEVTKKVIENIDFIYDENYEITEDDLIVGGTAPQPYDYEGGALFIPNDEYKDAIDYFDFYLCYGYEDSWEAMWDSIYPGEGKIYNNVYYYLAAELSLDSNDYYIFSTELTSNLIEKGYSIYVEQAWGEYTLAYIVKRIGYATGTSISSGEIEAAESVEVVADSPISNITSQLFNALPADKIQVSSFDGFMKYKNSGDLNYTNCEPDDIFDQYSEYLYEFFIETKEGYAFDSEFILNNLPEGSYFEVLEGNVYALVGYYLGCAVDTREEITSINIEVNQEFYQEYLLGVFSGNYPGGTVLDTDNKYLYIINNLYYVDLNGNLNPVEFPEDENETLTFEIGVQYVLGLVLITGANNEEEGFHLGNYKFADTVTVPNGFTVEKYNLTAEMLQFFGRRSTAVEVLYELPKLEYEEIEVIDITINSDFMANFKPGNDPFSTENLFDFNDQEPKYYVDDMMLGYMTEEGLQEVEFGSVFEIGVKYYAVVQLSTSYRDFAKYVFADDVTTSVKEGYSIQAFNLQAEHNYNSVILTYEIGELVLTDLNDDKVNIELDNVLTYNGEEQEQEIIVKCDGVELEEGIDYTVSGNVNTNAGKYQLTVAGISLYSGVVEIEYEIAKATYDMSGISFDNLSVIYDGNEHIVEITGTLPIGVTVNYENNKGTNVGTYNAVAQFTYDSVNYNVIEDMNAVLTIKKTTLSFNTDPENEISDDIIISSENGIDPSEELVVELIEVEISTEIFEKFLDKNQMAAVAYDVKLLKDGASVQPDGTLVFKILIPEELRNKEFNILHVHNGNESNMIEYEIEGDYVVFETDKLSEFVFVYDMGSLLWVAIILAVVAIFEIAFLVFLIHKKKEFKSLMMNAIYPPFIFGMFVPEWHIILIVVLMIIVVVLAIVDIIFAIQLFSVGKKASIENGTESDEEKEEIESVEEPQLEEVAIEEPQSEEAAIEEPQLEAAALEEPQLEEVAIEESQSDMEAVNAIESLDDENDEDTVKVWNEETHSYTTFRIVESFTARLIQSSEEVKKYYDLIKNELSSYKNVKSRISFKHEMFKIGSENIARLRFRGKTLCLYLALDPAKYLGSKYKIEDLSNVSNCAKVPTMYRINLPRRAQYSKELIYDLMKKLQAEKIDINFVNYSEQYPYEDTEALIAKGLIRRTVKVIGEGSKTVTVPNKVNIVKNVKASEVNNLISDEQVQYLVEQSTRIADRTKKVIINLDLISQYFNENETVTLEEIKKRVPNFNKKATYYKVLAKGTLDKPLTIDADDFSIEAEKMIILTGGKVLISKTR